MEVVEFPSDSLTTLAEGRIGNGPEKFPIASIEFTNMWDVCG